MSGSSRERHFEAVVGAFAPDLFRYAFWLCGDRQVAEDVVQETMIRAWKALDQLRDEASAKHWLFTIVRREHARLYERKRLETVDIDTPGLTDENLSYSEWNYEVRDVRRALAKLDIDYREPIVLQVMIGYSVKEIAAHMSLTEGAVLTRLFRARRKLKEILEQRGFTADARRR